MHFSFWRNRTWRWLPAVLLLFAGACGATPAAPQATALPAAPQATALPAAPQATALPATAAPAPAAPAPTSPPQATAIPAPTASPQATAAPEQAVLPAPLYFLDNDQIWRLERDGKTRRQLTFETFPVSDFDVGATDNALVYVVNRDGERLLVLLDASGRKEMIGGPVGTPRISPDGERIAFSLDRGVDGMQVGREHGSDTGVWIQGRTGGRPSLFQASEPIPDPNNPPDDARQFFPIAWSPDSTKLLMGVYLPVGDGGWLADKGVADGRLVEIRDVCCEAAWSADGAAITVADGTQIQDAVLGLWRADPATGKTVKVIDAPDESTYPLATVAHQFADGTIYAFLAMTKSPSIERPNPVAPHSVRADGSFAPLRNESYAVADALWAADASGAVVAESDVNANDLYGRLRWLPADGSAAIPLAGSGAYLRWGNPEPRPAADACGRYSLIAWEPPQGRAPRPEALDVQRRLLALGYDQAGAADGLYGDQTRAAVRAFQQASGLPATGDVDCATWGALLNGGARAP